MWFKLFLVSAAFALVTHATTHEPPVDIHFALVCIEWELKESMVSRKPEQPLVCPEIHQAKNCFH